MDGFLSSLDACCSSSSELEIDFELTRKTACNSQSLNSHSLTDVSTRDPDINTDETYNAQCLSKQTFRDYSAQKSDVITDRTFYHTQEKSFTGSFSCCIENVSEAQTVSNVSVSKYHSHHSVSSSHTHASLSEGDWFKQNGLNVMHLNIHYLYSKIDELKILLSQQQNIDILCVCETFLNDEFSSEDIQLQNYQLFRKDRKANGGGLLIYVKENLRCSQRDDLHVDGIEAMWLEVKHEFQKAFLLGYTYRPPSSPQRWMTDFEQILEQVFTENKEVILLGDFNLNLLDKNNHVRNWLQVTESVNLFQLVDTPTRVTALSSTVIDHAYSNMPENIVDIFVPVYAISDHYPVCLTRKMSSNSPSGSQHKTITYRYMRHFDNIEFLEDLESQPWSMLDNCENPNNALDFFLQIFETVLNKHAPQKVKRVKHVLQPNWFNEEIAEACKKRDYFHKKQDMGNFRVWRNNVKTLIVNSKRQYYAKNINSNKRNPKQLWKNLHDLTNKSKKYSTPSINKQDGEPVLDPEETANSFNDFFISVFEQYVTDELSTNCISDNLKTFIQTKLSSEVKFDIPPISVTYVKNQLASLDPTKATGLDGLSAKFLRISSSVIAAPLTKILNLSISTGIFPDSFKKAKVTPCFKKGDKSDKSNYRPISVLSLLSKIIEKHVAEYLKSYLESHDLLYERQSGFRSKHSCETALTAIVDDWISAIDNNEIIGTVLLDLSKAFDLVSHRLLLEKLRYYQFSDRSLHWFKSYFDHRSQQVSISGTLSSSKLISSGVPQGSVLGPLLFLIYINDLPLEIKKCIIDKFADDTTMSKSGCSVKKVTEDLNEDIKNAVKWCNNNKMAINTAKTKAMFITSAQKQAVIQENPPNLNINTTSIEISNKESLLGVTIDNTLNWSAQVEATIKKCNSLLFLLGRIKNFIDLPTRKLFFNAYILPHLDYCCTIWGNCSNELLHRIIKFQKRAARMILDKDLSSPSAELFRQLGWLTFDERVRYRKGIIMYKALHNLAPTYLSNKFTYTHNIHSLDLRSATNQTLYVPKPNLEMYRKSLSYSGPKLWNTLPESVRNAPSLGSFKQRYLRWKDLTVV